MKQVVSGELYISISTEFGNYLGVPTLIGIMTDGRYNFLLHKFYNRLNGGKARSLSFVGHVTLAKSVITSLLLYAMQSSFVSREVCDGIDKLVGGFIWGSMVEYRKIHLLCKEILHGPISEVGLAISHMRETNQATLAKLGWRLTRNPSSLWSRLIVVVTALEG